MAFRKGPVRPWTSASYSTHRSVDISGLRQAS
jgi:hypothetical protein